MLEEYIKGYAGQGIKIFPCNPNKSPATPQGFYSAHTNIDILLKQFKHETMLIGLPTGNTNKLVVIDIDVGKPDDNRSRDEILEALKEFGEIPDTYTVETPSGGLHLYYKILFTKLSSKRRFFDSSLSVDIRANGGYVCATDGNNYEVYDDVNQEEINNILERCAELPEWIENFTTNYSSKYKDPDETLLPPEEIIEIRSALAFLPSDDRDLWIKIGMCLKSTGSTSAFGLWNEWSQKSDKYNPKEMEKRWQTLKPADVTIATLFYEAKQFGWETTYHNKQQFSFEELSSLKKKSKEKIEKEKFPEDLLCPEGLVGDLVEYINQKSIKKQPIFALAGALTAVGALAGRKVKTETDIRTNIYCLNVGHSGCGKETARRIIKKCFQDAGCGNLASTEELASDAAIVTTLKENPSQVFLLDEIGRFLRTTIHAERNPHLYNIVSVLLKLYGNSDQTFYGKSYADADKRIRINQPNLCLLGTTVPDSLYKSLTRESIMNGLLSRIIIFESEDQNPKKENRKGVARKVPSQLLEQIRALHLKKINMRPCGNLDHLEPNPQIVDLTEPALILLKNFDTEIYKLRDELISQYRVDVVYNRSSQIAEQIALIIAVGKNIIDPVITEKDMEYSIKLVKYLSARMLYITENFVADSEHEHKVREVLQIIRKNGFIPATELTRRTQYLQAYIRNDIIETLKESEQIHEQFEGKGNKKKKIYIAL